MHFTAALSMSMTLPPCRILNTSSQFRDQQAGVSKASDCAYAVKRLRGETGEGAVHSTSSVTHIREIVKVKQMPRSVLSVCTVSQAENRKDSA